MMALRNVSYFIYAAITMVIAISINKMQHLVGNHDPLANITKTGKKLSSVR